MRVSFVLLTILTFLVACGGSPKPLTPELRELLNLINEVRASGTTCKKGGEHSMPAVAPLTENALLARAAQWHAEDMAAAGRLEHDTPAGAIHFKPGTTPGQRILNVGYQASATAENIAHGQTSPRQVLDDWLQSTDGHCEALMSPTYKHAGLGKSGNYWVLDMAAP